MQGVRRHDLEPVGAAPARPRIIAHARRTVFACCEAVVALSLALAGVAAVTLYQHVDGGDGDAGHFTVLVVVWLAVAFLVLSVAALEFARRSGMALQRLFDREDRLVMSLTHEVSGRLSRLLMDVENGLHGHVPSEEAWRAAESDGEAMNELIDDLGATARVMTGTEPLPHELVSLSDVARRAATSKVTDPNVEVRVHERPVSMVGSEGLVRLAISNLVRNAVKHGCQGGRGAVDVVVDERGVAVRDHGPGIPERVLAKLRRDIPRGLRRTPSGLGLSLACWAADVHQGTIELRNLPGGGFEARLALPVLNSVEQPDDDGAGTGASDGPATGSTRGEATS